MELSTLTVAEFDAITNEELHPKNFNRNEICEISRLAVKADFRRRKTDQFKGSGTGVIQETSYSEVELRCFPFIAVGLYFSAASVILQNNIKHTYVMMEPRLARSLRFIGIKFDQLGPVVDYHGQRAPFYINPSLFYSSLRPSFGVMLRNIQNQVKKQK